MAYSKQIYNKALDIIAKRKLNAQKIAQERHDKCVAIFPEIAELEKEMARCALEIPKAIGMGGDGVKFIAELAEKNITAQQKIKEILVSAKLPEDYLETKYSCEKCNDTGFVDGLKCDCLKECMKGIAYSEMSDKLPLDDSTFDNFDLSFYPETVDENTGLIPRQRMTEIYNFCKSYAEDFSKKSDSLIFYGETGLGKTHLSLAIAGKVSENGYGVIYGSAQSLLSSLEDEKFGRSSSDISAEKSMLSCDLLIIDDLGAEFSTQFTVSAIYNIINTRLLQKKPVIISTNLSPSEMENKYSRRIASRIYGNYTYMIFSGKDIRQIKSLF